MKNSVLKNLKVYPATHHDLVVYCAQHDLLIQDVASAAVASYLVWLKTGTKPLIPPDENGQKPDHDADIKLSK